MMAPAVTWQSNTPEKLLEERTFVVFSPLKRLDACAMPVASMMPIISLLLWSSEFAG